MCSEIPIPSSHPARSGPSTPPTPPPPTAAFTNHHGGHAGAVKVDVPEMLPPHSGPSAAGMSDDMAIVARGVSKCYHIYSKPRDRLKQVLARGRKTYYRPFWALRDVSFEVKRGEAVGIVGRNGSGKSTLLQIIAGTLTPTTGEVYLRGRVAALLELGSGFNPEFTGRDNVFLNGAILGVPRKEMERRFDEIAAFADIGDFLDQPVKQYSSGMHARLAFAVAISVDPDILILDEILAVGDMGFQQKCIARMRKLLDSGVTLLFVSHAPDAVKSLCRKGLFLADGVTQHWGSSEDAVNKYFGYIRESTNQQEQKARAELAKPIAMKTEVKGTLRYGNGHAQIEHVRLLDADAREVGAYTFGETVFIEASVRVIEETPNLDVAFVIRDATGIDLFGSGSADQGLHFHVLRAGDRLAVRFAFQCNLRGGNYGVAMILTRLPAKSGEVGITLDNVDACAAFKVVPDLKHVVHHKVYVPVSVSVIDTPQPGTASANTPAITPDPARPLGAAVP